MDLDPFGGAKLRPLGRYAERHSGSTLSKPQHLRRGVEGLSFFLYSLFSTPWNRRVLDGPYGPILGIDNNLIPFLCLEQYGCKIFGIAFLVKSNSA
jgi:hypothetical protein